MKKKKLLKATILIINYNNSNLVERCIKSVYNQTYKNKEIIFIDDLSSDDSYKKAKKFKFLKVFKTKQKTKYGSINQINACKLGILKSRGDIIFFLDSDDFFLKNKVKKIIKIFSSDKKTNYIQDLPLIILSKKKKIYKKFTNNALSFWPYLSPTSCISFRRKFIKKFIKSKYSLQNKYKDVWLDFRLAVFSYYIDKSFYCLRENLTCYKPLGASKKYPFLSLNWFFRRNYSFQYLQEISKNKIDYKFSFDYHITKFFYILKNIFFTSN